MPEAPPGAGGLAWAGISRDVLHVAGEEAAGFLQGQLSQDVVAIPAGGSALSWLLAPNGKVDALLRVSAWRGGFLIDTDGGYGAAVAARLERFKLRTKMTIEPLVWRVIALRGASAGSAVEWPAAGEGTEVAADASWPAWPGVDWLGPDPHPPAGAIELGAAAYEAARIAAGVPVMGAELTERTIPAETGLVGRTASFTKGCYTGQELVARIDSRGGNVARHLRVLHAGGPLVAGDALHDGPKQVGTVTSAAPDPAGGWVALAYVARSVIPPAHVAVGGESGQRAEVLPPPALP